MHAEIEEKCSVLHARKSEKTDSWHLCTYVVNFIRKLSGYYPDMKPNYPLSGWDEKPDKIPALVTAKQLEPLIIYWQLAE